jgi:hypothetical protein
LGAFQAWAELSTTDASRETVVLIQSPRGRELGTVLGLASPGSHSGQVLRVATPDDLRAGAESDRLAEQLFTHATTQATRYPVTFLDVEWLLEGPAILHFLASEPCDLDPLVVALSQTAGRPVQLLDVSRLPAFPTEPKSGCSSGNCGSGGGCGTGGGCSSGNCSRGTVRQADDLTDYFRDLRAKMEAAGMGRRPLH